MPVLPCARCSNDEGALRVWRKEGGEIPAKTCLVSHGAPCRTCKEVHPVNHDLRCDSCSIKRERKVRPMP